MRKVTYIGHSGFAVELDYCVLLFDYCEGAMPEFPAEKALYVFASHNHADHFRFAIFQLAQERANVTYLLSDDIRRARNAGNFAKHGVPEECYRSIRFLRPHEQVTVGDITVETLDSTDEGVAFLVTADETSVFHAGDLNDWVWEGEPEADNEAITAKWRAEIARIEGRHFDLAFVVLDPRQEMDFWRGIDWFMRHTQTDKVYPMHFWKDWSVFSRLRELPCSEPYRDKIASECEYQN